MVWGIDKTVIFRDDRDKMKFLERMGVAVTEGKCAVYAWALWTTMFICCSKAARWAYQPSCEKS
jgi:hypothetical protein